MGGLLSFEDETWPEVGLDGLGDLFEGWEGWGVVYWREGGRVRWSE